MSPYWALFALPALFCRRLIPVQQPRVWTLVAATAMVYIVLRFEVGGDWGTYREHVRTASEEIDWALTLGGPTYYLLGWISAQLGASIYWLNLFCALLLVAGIF